MAGNTNFDTLLSTTINKHREKLTDNVFKKHAFSYWLQRKARVREDGGVKIIEPLMYGENSTFKTYSGYDSLDLTPQTGITAAEYDWKMAAIGIALSREEELKNAGSSQKINLLKAKITQAEMSLSKNLNSLFITSDGTGNSGKYPNGLANLVFDDSGSLDTVGGIDCSVAGNEFWRSTVSTGADVALTVTGATGLNHWYNTAGRGQGDDNPDLELTTQDLFEAYEALIYTKIQYQDTETVNAGFQNLTHKGGVVMWDALVPAKHWYFLNSKYISLVTHESEWLRTRGPFEEKDQNAKWWNILCMFQLTTNNRSRHAVVKRYIP